MSSFIESLPKLPLASEMRLWDATAIEFGIPDEMLMENAARTMLDLLAHLHGDLSDLPVLLLMGGGNNGGDAACMARHLLELGAKPLVAHVKNLEELGGACKFHATLALKDDVCFKKIATTPDPCENIFFRDFCQTPPAIIIDALLGTGFKGQLHPALQKIINDANAFAQTINARVFSVDIPSGLDACSGRPSPTAIRANATATLAAPKPGLVLPHARQWTGKLYTRKIGMPAKLQQDRPSSFRLLDGRIFLRKEKFPANSYKNIYGHIYILGGFNGLSGAAHLAASSALRAGAGLVTACAPASALDNIKGNWPEIMTMPCGTSSWPISLDPAIADKLQKADALVIGPGMGRAKEAGDLLAAILDISPRPPAIFDADALILLAQNPALLSRLTEKDILTPHPGEAAALLGKNSAEIQKDRPQALRKLCQSSPAVAILKGAGTILSQKDRPIILCPYDIPQMAIGGAGDVLSGCAGALLGRKDMEDSLDIAARAVMLHAAAGMLCASHFTQRGALATDLANAISTASAYISSLDQSEIRHGLTPWP